MTGSELLLAAGVDAVAGDPQCFPHPVRAMGIVITWCDEQARKLCRRPHALRISGLMLALGLPLCVFALSHGAVNWAEGMAWWFGSFLSITLGWTTLAGRDLLDHVHAVMKRLEQDDLSGARQAVSRIVGRDTERLSEEEVVRATIETTAESTNDGIIAPLFYLVVGGAPLALAYKAVNTLDSMVGHRDERHIDFGWASARLDDAANWIPARLSAVLILVAAALVIGGTAPIRTGWHVLWRDGGRHPSPNSGRPEAAMAGSLGIQLGGINYYDGVPDERPLIGTGRRRLVLKDLTIASRVTIVACLLGVLIAAGTVWLV